MRCTLLVTLAVALGACQADVHPPQAGPLKAGVATVPLDAPVGTPTGGYSRTARAGDPKSPWADTHPATVGVQTLPTARAVALADGVTTAVVVRVDLCLTTATLRWRAQEALAALGHDVPLLVSATHTHSGPARYFHPAPVEGSGGFDPTKAAMDGFDAEVEARLAQSIAQAAAQALAGLTPASMGVATVEAGELNRDRRCQNDDLYGPGFRDTTLTVVRLDAVDETGAPQRPLTGLVHFALHGTVLDEDNLLFSTDAPGAIELFSSDAVGVPLLFLQGAAGDVSPDTGGRHADFQGAERIGRLAARKVQEAWARAAPPAAPAQATLRRFELPVDPSREAIGYARGEFAENGAVGCGLGAHQCPAVEVAPSSLVCLPLKRRPFRETTVQALQLEGVLIGSLPGEPTAALGERVKEAGAQLPGVTHVLTAGYAQDHFGYLLEEKDYLRLGYEPYVSPLGWKFGAFIAGQLGQAFAALGAPAPLPTRPVTEAFVARVVSGGAVPAQVAPPSDVRRLEAAAFVFEGGDPSLGTPRVRLEKQEPGGDFAPVRASPVRLVEGGPDIVLFLEPSPSYEEAPVSERRAHRWRAVWETLADTPTGRYRLVAEGRALTGNGLEAYVVRSDEFSVAPAQSLGQRASARLSATGVLSATFRFPPNPSEKDARGVVVRHFRLRDEDASAQEGAPGRGGAASGTLTSPDATRLSVTLAWDVTQGAYVVSGIPVASGTYTLEVPPGALVDGAGNTNGAPLSVTATRP
ncbi:MAG: neutral/alkaline non-lysosomal ceramidase N-terminal domain-containing protein [Myxococcota bacterium]